MFSGQILTEPIVEDFQQGYPRLAAFINSDRDFVVFRRFGQLHVRFLLDMQDELAELEQQLHELDQQDTFSFNLNSRRQDKNAARKVLLEEMGNKLYVYDKGLEAYYRHIERLPSKRTHVESVVNWMKGNKPLVAEESEFLNTWDDLISPRERADYGGLDIFISGCASHTHKSNDKHVIMVNTSYTLVIARLLATFMAIAILTIPIAVLYRVSNMSGRLWIIGIFTGLFSSVLSIFTQSRNYEIFSATAAYCAVMVVFVGNVQ
ncbi:uncharacterized protein BDZ99DRAFT_383497 [Mytilinidion resinicola]|uniref:DUF6594 domain-containing protein n=1 Tax=Mytilinidion resinicola TaxID=574789 RepID=A0A6A6YWS9_9PEZI|nr:uncharacterized protein BDZ99DRAFT_383497 [Mytilinidion resinicola]KAF2812454.1 hypothetical protein BDZ99DRAFT_383497 [Mytilinidion resinicola]